MRLIPKFEDGLTSTSEILAAITGNDFTGTGTLGDPYASIEGAVGHAVLGQGYKISLGRGGSLSDRQCGECKGVP